MESSDSSAPAGGLEKVECGARNGVGDTSCRTRVEGRLGDRGEIQIRDDGNNTD